MHVMGFSAVAAILTIPNAHTHTNTFSSVIPLTFESRDFLILLQRGSTKKKKQSQKNEGTSNKAHN